MQQNKVIDQYTLETEIQDESAALPVRCIATNTDDESTAEAWLTFDRTADLYRLVYGELAELQMELLREHRYHELIAQESPRLLCVVNSLQLVPFGFFPDDMRPRHLETVMAKPDTVR